MKNELAELKEENSALNEELVKQKHEFSREDALIRQNLEFKEKTITELHAKQQLIEKQYEDYKREHKSESKEKFDKLDKESVRSFNCFSKSISKLNLYYRKNKSQH